MRLIDAIRNVERPDDPNGYHFTAPADAICESLGINQMGWFGDDLGKRLRAYPIFNWICTDEHVGLDALYLDDEPVGCTYRRARKSSYEVEWLSLDVANVVRSTILSYSEYGQPAVLDPDQDIGDDYEVHYVSQALTDDATYEGRPVRALIWYDQLGRTTPAEYRLADRAYQVGVPFGHPYGGCVLVRDGDRERLIKLSEFRMAFNVETTGG